MGALCFEMLPSNKTIIYKLFYLKEACKINQSGSINNHKNKIAERIIMNLVITESMFTFSVTHNSIANSRRFKKIPQLLKLTLAFIQSHGVYCLQEQVQWKYRVE
ncbi:hypothetical protein NE237_001588 [Protea cynaroides]|uniref:Uncharacterized protein n=1 Tax=Protea cynaroides TaxID=273540 RepID=A0A9Q0QYI6_9MAGN|nr:hypothetical protein NE237_001588 [Protea cynaroides]